MTWYELFLQAYHDSIARGFSKAWARENAVDYANYITANEAEAEQAHEILSERGK